MTSDIMDLIGRQPAGHSLLGPFYSSEEIYRFDLASVWRRGWLFACHSCEIAHPGEYITLDVDADSLVVVRDEQGQAQAWHNVCRHRGSLVVGGPCGRAKRLVCPYHQWSYGLNGPLLHAPAMQPSLDKSHLGLRPVHIREVEGLIYVCLAETAPAFDEARDLIASLAKPQGLNRAKVAKAVDYLVKANWKLVWENNRECFHCNANHPQYIKANFDHYNADDTTARIRELMAAAVQRSEANGRPVGSRSAGRKPA